MFNAGYTLCANHHKNGNCKKFGEEMTNHESITIHYS